jgi:hypothetical protein
MLAQDKWAVMCENILMTPENDIKPEPGRQTWSSPNVGFCRARRFGVSDVVFCLMDDGHNCGFAIRFGQGVFCRHPDREKIIARTRANSASLRPGI